MAGLLVARFWMLMVPVVFLHTTSAEKETVVGVRLQADGKPSNTSLITWVGRSVPELNHFTICAYLRMQRDMISSNTIISYAIPDNYNELVLGLWGDVLGLYTDEQILRINVSYTPLRWYKFCHSYDLDSRSHTTYWNDHQVFTYTPDSTAKVKGGGLLIVGQEQDQVGGGYTFPQSLSAVVGDLRLYDRVISQSEAQDYVHCIYSNLDPKPVVDFSDIANDWVTSGSVALEDLTLSDICQQESNFIMFPEARSYSESVAFCSYLGASLAVPASPEENQLLMSIMKPYLSECRDASGFGTHLGILKEMNTFQHYETGSNLTYKNFKIGYDVGDCVAYIVLEGEEGFWSEMDCELKLCTFCNFSSITFLKIRGLCKDSVFDGAYSVLVERGKKPVFRGYSYSQLEWTETTSWTITYLPDPTIRATMIDNLPDDYPLGLKYWKMDGDHCSSRKQDTRGRPLVLSMCREDEFTCDDGSCVNIDYRCDLLPHCVDFSDEINCSTVKLSEIYISELPPTLPDGSPPSVSVHVNVTSMRELSLIDLSISFDMTLVFTWRDSRLTFAHLRDSLDMNNVHEDTGLWRPEVFLEDGAGSRVDIKGRGTDTFVRRVSPPIPDTPLRLKEDQQFKGSENDLVETRPLTVWSSCQFDLSMYPFDVQECRVLIRSSLSASRLTLLKEGINFLGSRLLLEYRVSDVSMEEGNKDGKTHITIIFTFSNFYKYYITGTYVPTTLLLIITYLTFYFPWDDFTDRIMVSLTALMVMAALFLQTNQSMPRTAYLKVVDIWFVFCIIMKFVIVVWLVVINFVRLREEKMDRKQEQATAAAAAVVPKGNKAAWVKVHSSTHDPVSVQSMGLTTVRLHVCAQFVIPGLFFGFVIFYLTYIIIHKLNW